LSLDLCVTIGQLVDSDTWQGYLPTFVISTFVIGGINAEAVTVQHEGMCTRIYYEIFPRLSCRFSRLQIPHVPLLSSDTRKPNEIASRHSSSLERYFPPTSVLLPRLSNRHSIHSIESPGVTRPSLAVSILSTRVTTCDHFKAVVRGSFVPTEPVEF